MDLKSTLRVFNQTEVSEGPGIAKGQTIKVLAGSAQYPAERIRVSLASFKPGTHEYLHWHLIEVFYYIISGRAVMKDIEGRAMISDRGVWFTPLQDFWVPIHGKSRNNCSLSPSGQLRIPKKIFNLTWMNPPRNQVSNLIT